MGKVKDLIIPTVDVNDDKVTIGDIKKNNLEFIEVGEVIYSVETSKAVTDFKVDFAGYVVLYVEDGDEVKVGDSAGMIFEDIEDAKVKLSVVQERKAIAKRNASINASKKAIAYAEELGLDITKIKKDGIIKTKDIDEFIAANGK